MQKKAFNNSNNKNKLNKVLHKTKYRLYSEQKSSIFISSESIAIVRKYRIFYVMNLVGLALNFDISCELQVAYNL